MKLSFKTPSLYSLEQLDRTGYGAPYAHGGQ
jgi:hypothetical protein